MKPSELAKRIKRGEKWRISDEAQAEIAELVVALDYVLAEAQETVGKKVMLIEPVKVEIYDTMLKLAAKHKEVI